MIWTTDDPKDRAAAGRGSVAILGISLFIWNVCMDVWMRSVRRG